MKYESIITSIGDTAIDLLKDDNCLILFDDSIKDQMLMDISVVHSRAEHKGEISKGDSLVIGDYKFELTAVGDTAKQTFKDIGHFTIKFDGLDEVELPGEVQVRGKLGDIKVGDKILIF